MGRKIPTATGFIDVDKMGITTMHEHVVAYNPETWDREDSNAFAISELKKAKALGLNTLVEVSPWRDAEAVRYVAEEAEMNIILCTGFYAVLSEEQQTYTVDQFKRHMMDEIENGIGNTGIIPGVIKIGTNNSILNEIEVRAITAAGIVQKETGLPVCIHSVTGCKNQQDVFEEAGADLTKIYFSHIEAEQGWEGRTVDEEINYLDEVLKKGSYLSYNNFGNWAHTKKEHLVKIIHELNARGYSDKQFATLDFIWFYENGVRKVLWEDINPHGKERSYSYLLSNVVPWLKENNLTDQNVKKMIEDNAKKIFGL